MSEKLFEQLTKAVIDGEADDARSLAQKALDQGVDPLDCIENGLVPGIREVGRLFAAGDYFLPALVLGAGAMESALEVLEPALVEGKDREVVGRVVLGTVEGDLHEIGKTLVGTMLTANGFKVTDLGVDQPAEAFVDAIEEYQADIVGASALLTTTMSHQKKLLDALQARGLRDRVKVMVGGAPVTQSYADKIGADGYAEDAISAVDLAFRLIDGPV